MSAIARVRLRRLPAPRLRRPRLRTLLCLVLVLGLLGGGWLWVRGSALVSVDRVTVTGLRGPGSSKIRAALLAAAKNMTTLEVDAAALRVAVAPFPVVKSIRVSTQFPHGMRIRVLEQTPVADLTVDGRRIPVAADGTLLPSSAGAALASIPVSVPPGGTRVAAGPTLGAVYVLAAAPEWLRARVVQVSDTPSNGLVAEMHNGPEIYFGDATLLRAKWTAAAAVLADPGAEGAAYIDVTVPERPAAGGVASTTNSSSTGSEASTLSGAAATGAVGATTAATGPDAAATGNTSSTDVADTGATTGAAGAVGGASTGAVGAASSGNAPAP